MCVDIHMLSRRCIEKAEEVASKIKENGGQAVAVPGDMLDDKYITELVKKAAEFGQGKIHIIVCTACSICAHHTLTINQVNNAGYTWDGVVHKVPSPLPSPPHPAHHTPLTSPHTDNRQTMGHDPRAPRRRPLQAHPRRSPLLPRQRQRAPLHHKHLQHLRPARQRRPSQLRLRQSRRRRPHQSPGKRMGARLQRARQRRRVRVHPDTTYGREGKGRVCRVAGWHESCAWDSGEAGGGEGAGRVSGYSAGETGDGDRGGGGGVGGCEPVVWVC